MQPESMNETVHNGTGAFVRSSPPANDLTDVTGGQQHWLRFEAARYIEQLLGELGAIARAAELRHLFYVLDIARQEAGTQAQRLQREH